MRFLRDLKLLDQKWFFPMAILPFLEPAFFSYQNGFVHEVYKYPLILSFLVAAWLVLEEKKLPGRVIFCVAAYYVIQFVAQKIVAKAEYIYVREALGVMGLCLYVWLGLRKNPRNLLGGMTLMFEVLLYANLLSILIFPNGMYQTMASGSGGTWENWLLGYRNTQIRTLLPGACLALMYAQVTRGRVTLRAAAYIAVMAGTMLYIKSATALVGLAVFLALMAIFRKRALPRWASILNANLLTAVVFFLIVTVGIQNLFAFVFENVLGRDTDFTGRVVVWQRAWDYIVHSPFWGRPEFTEIDLLGGFSHPHNYWLNILMRGGLALILPVLPAYWFASSGALRAKDQALAKYVVITLTAFAVMGMVESLTEAEMLFPLLLIASELGVTLEQPNALEDRNTIQARGLSDGP